MHGAGSPAAFRRLCVETGAEQRRYAGRAPAAFRRLCVETPVITDNGVKQIQPPSGGCVLKPAIGALFAGIFIPPPSGGCVLSTIGIVFMFYLGVQPPSGGCVLKLVQETLE